MNKAPNIISSSPMDSNKPVINSPLEQTGGQNFWAEKITIGALQVPRFMAAPLDGVTDSPLRQLIRDFSPDELLMTEMRHISQVANERDERCLQFQKIEQPLAFQFSANRKEFMEKAIEKVIANDFKLINLNCGCPSKTVTSSGSGSALMANTPLLKELLTHFVKIIDGRLPMTIKIRAGYKERNAVEIAKIAEDHGMACIMIHPRTQPDGFTSRLDFDITRKVKESVKIPVIFSGNVNSFSRAQKTYDLTGVDGFMVGRALWGAPWKMREITDESLGKTFKVDDRTALVYALKHFNLNVKHYGKYGFNVFKKQLPQYIRSIDGAAEWRGKLLRCTTEHDMRTMLEQLCTENGLVINTEILFQPCIDHAHHERAL